MRIGIVFVDKIFGIKKPLRVIGHDLESKSVGMAVRIGKGNERRVYQYHIWIGRVWIHPGGDRKGIMRTPLIARKLEGFTTMVR
jgi:hypothetical protein